MCMCEIHGDVKVPFAAKKGGGRVEEEWKGNLGIKGEWGVFESPSREREKERERKKKVESRVGKSEKEKKCLRWEKWRNGRIFFFLSIWVCLMDGKAVLVSQFVFINPPLLGFITQRFLVSYSFRVSDLYLFHRHFAPSPFLTPFFPIPPYRPSFCTLRPPASSQPRLHQLPDPLLPHFGQQADRDQLHDRVRHMSVQVRILPYLQLLLDFPQHQFLLFLLPSAPISFPGCWWRCCAVGLVLADDTEKTPQQGRREERDQRPGARPFERLLLSDRRRGRGWRRKGGVRKEGGPQGGQQGGQQGCRVEVCDKKVMEIPKSRIGKRSVTVFLFATE